MPTMLTPKSAFFLVYPSTTNKAGSRTTESVVLFSARSDTANHEVVVSNMEDERVPDGKPWLTLDYLVLRS